MLKKDLVLYFYNVKYKYKEYNRYCYELVV